MCHCATAQVDGGLGVRDGIALKWKMQWKCKQKNKREAVRLS